MMEPHICRGASAQFRSCPPHVHTSLPPKPAMTILCRLSCLLHFTYFRPRVFVFEWARLYLRTVPGNLLTSIYFRGGHLPLIGTTSRRDCSIGTCRPSHLNLSPTVQLLYARIRAVNTAWTTCSKTRAPPH